MKVSAIRALLNTQFMGRKKLKYEVKLISSDLEYKQYACTVEYFVGLRPVKKEFTLSLIIIPTLEEDNDGDF